MLSPCVHEAEAFVFSMAEHAREVAIDMRALTAVDAFT